MFPNYYLFIIFGEIFLDVLIRAVSDVASEVYVVIEESLVGVCLCPFHEGVSQIFGRVQPPGCPPHI